MPLYYKLMKLCLSCHLLLKFLSAVFHLVDLNNFLIACKWNVKSHISKAFMLEQNQNQ